ncbi:jmjC domain-containing protein 4 [Coffea eugenioides]|uniref:jmjC domain-containing protein 4 n=1 Tax=Coffea eugenioides TaxID=49369 RepID=UPI000F6130B8|nr:jmjC domain-containing protein 4 [Coffea eugenioides]
MGLKIERRVERVNGKDLSYTQFVQQYLVQNQPVILTGLMEDWRACKDWILEDGKPNLQFFSTHFGNSKVQVADCGARECMEQKRLEMSVSEFIEKWVQLSSSRESISNEVSDDKSLLYLKDWHFVKEYPEYCAYRTPLFFCDDWLNMYLDKYDMHTDPDSYQKENEISCSDYRFVYMGPKGTWTPLHADVFRSYSWSANICGKKQWFFLSPSQHHLVFDRYMTNAVYNIFEDVSETKFPGFKEAIWWECTQEQNEIIFVPSGWYHQVHNQEDTISINHNWFNAYNLSWVWDILLTDYKQARDLIEDIKEICDDFEGLCQRNLAANTGMNFRDFLVFMMRFAFANLFQFHHLGRSGKNPLFWSSQIAQHIVFNLQSIQSIALKMKSVGVCTHHAFSLKPSKILEDHSFMELFTTLKKNYGMMHGPFEIVYEEKMGLCSDMDAIFCDFTNPSIGSSEDLVQLIDFAFEKLGFVASKSLPSRKTRYNLEEQLMCRD